MVVDQKEAHSRKEFQKCFKTENEDSSHWRKNGTQWTWTLMHNCIYDELDHYEFCSN